MSETYVVGVVIKDGSEMFAVAIDHERGIVEIGGFTQGRISISVDASDRLAKALFLMVGTYYSRDADGEDDEQPNADEAYEDLLEAQAVVDELEEST